MIVALKENWHINHPPKNLVPDPVEHLADEEHRHAADAGHRAAAAGRAARCSRAGHRQEPRTDRPPKTTTTTNPCPASAERAQQDSDDERGSSEMTWTNRLRLFGGILGVLLVVAALTLVFNQRQIKVTSLDATVATDTYDVGAAYGGTVTKQFVNEGDVVAKGDKLFTLQSVPLQQDLSNGLELQRQRGLRRRRQGRHPHLQGHRGRPGDLAQGQARQRAGHRRSVRLHLGGRQRVRRREVPAVTAGLRPGGRGFDGGHPAAEQPDRAPGPSPPSRSPPRTPRR